MADLTEECEEPGTEEGVGAGGTCHTGGFSAGWGVAAPIGFVHPTQCNIQWATSDETKGPHAEANPPALPSPPLHYHPTTPLLQAG